MPSDAVDVDGVELRPYHDDATTDDEAGSQIQGVAAPYHDDVGVSDDDDGAAAAFARAVPHGGGSGDEFEGGSDNDALPPVDGSGTVAAAAVAAGEGGLLLRPRGPMSAETFHTFFDRGMKSMYVFEWL